MAASGKRSYKGSWAARKHGGDEESGESWRAAPPVKTSPSHPPPGLIKQNDKDSFERNPLFEERDELKRARESQSPKLAALVDAHLTGHVSNMRAFAMGRVTNFLFQELFHSASAKQRALILDCLLTDEGSLREFLVDRHGTRSFQKMIKVASPGIEIERLASVVLPLVGELGQDRQGCYVLLCFLDPSIPLTQRGLITDAILEHFSLIARSAYGSRVIQVVLEKGAVGVIPSVALIAAQVARNAPEFILDSHANFLVSTLMQCASRFRAEAETCIRTAILGCIPRAVLDQRGSHVIQATLEGPISQISKRTVLEQLCTPAVADTIVAHQYGNYVAQSAIRAAAAVDGGMEFARILLQAAERNTTNTSPRFIIAEYNRVFPPEK